MLVTFGSSLTILMTFMLCIPTTSLAPASSTSSPDAWVAGSDKEKEKDKDKDDEKDGFWVSDADNMETDNVSEAWAEKVLADPSFDRGWCQPCADNWNWKGDRRVAYCEVREFPLTVGSRPIAIDGGDNGGMTVMGWDKRSARMIYRIRARARTEERAREVARAVRLVNHGGWVRAEGPATSSTGDWWSVEMKTWVPRESDVALKTINGPLGIRGVRGTMNLEAENGPVSLVDLGGAVVAQVQNGPLHVELTGSSWQGKGLDAHAQNGPVNLVLPERYSARLQTGTINGPRSMEYALEMSSRSRGWVTTTLGSGGAPVRVVTENGPYHVGSH